MTNGKIDIPEHIPDFFEMAENTGRSSEMARAEQMRKANQLAFDSIQELFHRMNPARHIPPTCSFEPGTREQMIEERIARVEMDLAELRELLK
jgi:hypothetical protein